MSSIGGCACPGRPRCMFVNACCVVVNRRRASSSVSATTAWTHTIAYGCSSWADGRNSPPVGGHRRLDEGLRGEVRGERVRQAEVGGELGTEERGTQDVEGDGSVVGG